MPSRAIWEHAHCPTRWCSECIWCPPKLFSLFASFCFPIEINDAVPLSYLVQPDLDQIWQKLVAGVWGSWWCCGEIFAPFRREELPRWHRWTTMDGANSRLPQPGWREKEWSHWPLVITFFPLMIGSFFIPEKNWAIGKAIIFSWRTFQWGRERGWLKGWCLNWPKNI